MTLHPQYITDDKGNKQAVILPINEYKKLLEQLDDIEDVRLYDEVKTLNEPSIPFDEYVKKRNSK